MDGQGKHEGSLDTFESTQAEDLPEPSRASIDLDDLPIELVGLTDRYVTKLEHGDSPSGLTASSFIDSLSAKIHPTPPNIDNLSLKFQAFYATAASHINTHIAALLSRQKREQSPAPSIASRTSAASLFRAKAASIGSREKTQTPSPKTEVEQQMITADELADRKKARRALEQRRGLYEEAVERRLCEGIYDRIYRHRSSQDEAQDDKLRSKTAALAVVGIGPADLGVNLGEMSSPSAEAVAEKQEEVRQWLEQARKEIILMNLSRYPLGKLNHLKAAHKAIVDTLSHFHPSSSADEIMPMLIYTLITMLPEQLNIISDLKFINRFRWEQKIEGEAAYCLTNLEAAIVFLETVDLSTLREDEAPSGPLKAPSVPATPKSGTFPPAYLPGISTAIPSLGEADTATAAGIKSSPSPAGLKAAVPIRNRRLSDLVNTPAQAFSSASDAVMNTFNAADQSIKTIGSSLEGSYRLFLGKFGRQEDASVPKTLDDARKLIGTPPPDDDGSVSGSSSIHSPEEVDVGRRVVLREDKVLTMVGGRKASRDHSADSSRSAASSKKVLFAEEARKDGGGTPSSVVSNNPALIDSVRNFGNSINPMSRLSGIGGFRGFGRTTSTPAAPLTRSVAEGGDLATVRVLMMSTLRTQGTPANQDLQAFPDIAPALPPKPQIAPPVKKFMELQNPADLRLGDVLELLRDYRRLAGALKDMGAYKES
jgi:hypothetical protein